MNTNNCIFCKIIKGEIPSTIVYETKEVLVFMDIQPVNKGHVLIVPKKHAQLVSELDDIYIQNLMIIGKKVSKAIRQSKIPCEGINFYIADGEAAGQEVPHVHLHLIPRFKNDGFRLVFPEGYGHKPERRELEVIAEKICVK